MAYDFDAIVNRRGTRSYKWDQSERLFGDADILPLWVADMDFTSPPEVERALVERAQQGIYGYTIRMNSYLDAITGWFARRHGWPIRPEWVSDSPGVVTSLALAVECFSEPGQRIIVQPPVYYPFFDVVRMNGRELAYNPLIERNGAFAMDYDHLESLLKEGAAMLLLCNPHNPGGRVWTREELLRLGELCLQYGVTVVSDEIHCDHVYAGHKHIPFASLSDEIAAITLTCLAPSKSFNLPGLQSSFAVTPNDRMRRTFETRVKTLSLHMTNYFAPVATEAAYTHGDRWLDELLVYLQGNIDVAMSFMAQRLPELRPMRPQGTYLLWTDCRALGRGIPELKELMFKRARVAFSEGSVFGKQGEGYLRINLACPRSLLTEALERFAAAVRG